MRAPRHPLFAMVAPLALWALHLVLVYSLVGLHCGAPPAWLPRVGPALLATGLVLATLGALVAIAALGGSAMRRARSVDRAAPGEEHGQPRFLARVQAGVALLAALAVAFTALPMLLLEPCP